MELRVNCACMPTTTTTTTTDYRKGQVAGCDGCRGRRDECWSVCGHKAGYCSACDTAQGSMGACCMQDKWSDPPECKNAIFNQRGYHECVVVNPLMPTTTTTTTTDYHH